ncbi:MAG: Transcriptional regulator, AsnC family, partial [uncultured Frankineae bacterium]
GLHRPVGPQLPARRRPRDVQRDRGRRRAVRAGGQATGGPAAGDRGDPRLHGPGGPGRARLDHRGLRRDLLQGDGRSRGAAREPRGGARGRGGLHRLRGRRRPAAHAGLGHQAARARHRARPGRAQRRPHAQRHRPVAAHRPAAVV